MHSNNGVRYWWASWHGLHETHLVKLQLLCVLPYENNFTVFYADNHPPLSWFIFFSCFSIWAKLVQLLCLCNIRGNQSGGKIMQTECFCVAVVSIHHSWLTHYHAELTFRDFFQRKIKDCNRVCHGGSVSSSLQTGWLLLNIVQESI